MKRLRFTLVKNAFANLVRMGASGVVALLLPHFLTRDLSVDRYAVWALMLQIAAYAGYLDFGLQTAVARFVAQAEDRGDTERRNQVIGASFLLLIAAAGIAFVMAAVVAWQIPHLFRSAPTNLVGELRGGVLVLSASAAILLTFSTFTGVLVGLHRNDVPAIAIGGTRILGAVSVVLLAHHTQSLVALAACVGGFNLVGGIAQLFVCQRLLPTMRLNFGGVTRKFMRELLDYCTGLTVFNFGMLLVSGLDLTIVGYFAFRAAAYYSVASTVTAFLIGAANSIYSAILASLAVLEQRGEMDRFRKILFSVSSMGSYVSLTSAVVVMLAGRPLLSAWVGPAYAEKALPLLVVLLWAQVVRLTGGPYSVALIATGQQKHGISTAIAEGFTNLIMSIVGAWLIGPMGVALGTLIGAMGGCAWLCLHVIPQVTHVPVTSSDFVQIIVLRPLFCFLPLLAFVVLRARMHLGGGALLTSVGMTLILLYFLGQIPRFSRSHAI